MPVHGTIGVAADFRDHVVFKYTEDGAKKKAQQQQDMDNVVHPGRVSRVRQFFYGYSNKEVLVDPKTGGNTCPLVKCEYED